MHRRAAALLICLLAAALSLSLVHREEIRSRLVQLTSNLDGGCDKKTPRWLSDVRSWAKRHKLPGIQIHLIQNGDTYECAFGKAITPDGKRIAMNAQAVLPYASLTKIFTASMVLIEVHKGTMSMDDRIYELLSLREYPLPNEQRWQTITIEHLLSHRAGFNRAVSGDPTLWPKSPCPHHLNELGRATTDFEPGGDFAYSNLGYCLLGVALERLSSERFTALLDRQLLSPLHLSSVRVTDPDNLQQAGTALYFANSSERRMFHRLDWPARQSMGALAGTTGDFAQLLVVLSRNRQDEWAAAGKALLSPREDCDETRWRTCHGLAFYSHRENSQERMFWRDGSLPGVTAFAAITVSGNIFVLLANSRDPNWMPVHDELGKIVYENLAGIGPWHSLPPDDLVEK
ncbi:serine hydrolase domain-containing protein [Steroidobacter denitrificans]|nr:serine hydrolase domain-containing protein [Steroidobacter denitrificans]